MTNYVLYNPSGRILGNIEDLDWITQSGDASLQYIEHEPVDPKTHKVINSEIVSRAQAEIDAEQTRLKKNREWAAFRQKRNLMLQKTDWTQLPDSGRDRRAWAAYRQSLRDLPANTTDPRTPQWPNRPE